MIVISPIRYEKKTKDVHFDQDSVLTNETEFQSSPQEILLTEELRKQINAELQKIGASDDEIMLFECLADGIDNPKELRKELGITEREFHNLWRKFNRRRDIIRKKYSEYGF